MTGIRFHFPTNLSIYVGDRIEVKFILDDPQKTNIHKEVRILNSANDQYGWEFLNLANEEKRLGYYLFPVRAWDVPRPLKIQEAPQVQVEDRTAYLRPGNVKFRDQLPKLPDQETS